MDFFDNVVRSSNALIKDKLNNPFGGGKQRTSSKDGGDQQQQQQASEDSQEPAEPGTRSAAPEDQSQPAGADQAPDSSGTTNSQFAAIAADAEAVTQKAVKGAKDFGSFLFSMANKAGQTVSQTAKQVKQAVESTSILTDFTKEQQEFIKEHGGTMQAGELPWANCQDEEKAANIREQVLSLSQDKRNFVRSPPNDANFEFNSQQCYPTALSLLKEDPNLGKMRFELVPKLVNEDTFWRNYFYRVYLLKQMSDRGEDLNKKHGWASSRSSSGEGPDEMINDQDNINQDYTSPNYDNTLEASAVSAGATTTTAINSNEAINAIQQNSDFGSIRDSALVDNISGSNLNTYLNYNFDQTNTFNNDLINQELESSKLIAEADDLKSKLRELNIGSMDDGTNQDDIDDWDEELQRDLQEFELVSGGDVSAMDEEVLDKELMELKRTSQQ